MRHINSESKGNYLNEDPIKFLTGSLESSLCVYSDANVLVTGNIGITRNIAAANAAGQPQRKQALPAATQVAFKNFTPFKKNKGQKSMKLLLMKLILLILQCLCTI